MLSKCENSQNFQFLKLQFSTIVKKLQLKFIASNLYLEGGGGGGLLFFKPKFVNRAGTCGGSTSIGLTGSRRIVGSGFVSLVSFSFASVLTSELFFSFDDTELVLASRNTG